MRRAVGFEVPQEVFDEVVRTWPRPPLTEFDERTWPSPRQKDVRTP